MRTLAIALLLTLSACGHYRDVLQPLKHLPPDCYCRYAAMAKHYYFCTYHELLDADHTRRVAHDSAVIRTHLFIAETQLNISERNRKRMCNCREVFARKPW